MIAHPQLLTRTIITKNMSGKIHQKAGQGIACHHGHGYRWAGAWSAASADEAQARLSRDEWKQIRVRLVMDIGSSVNHWKS
jgi:hypothetical protein